MQQLKFEMKPLASPPPSPRPGPFQCWGLNPGSCAWQARAVALSYSPASHLDFDSIYDLQSQNKDEVIIGTDEQSDLNINSDRGP